MDDFAREFLPIKKYLDAAGLRNRVIVNNLANANTPNFRRSDVNFSEYLQEAVKTEDLKRLHQLKPEVIPGEGRVKADGNNVDLDMEVGLLNKNILLYRTCLHLLSMKIDLLKTAITRNR